MSRKPVANKIKYDRDTKAFHRQVVLDEMVKRGGCAHCGETDVRVLEWDHLFDKKHNISAMIGKQPLNLILKEMEKCQILCSNDHRRKTCSDSDNYKQRYYASTQNINE